jgi:DNA polymerase I
LENGKSNRFFGKVRYKGKVCCVEVEDNHTVFVGRNKKFNWCGQSIYGVLGFFRSRYFVEDVAKTITYVGREINLHTQRVVEDCGYSVITSDTDSAYVKLPDEYTLDECIDKGEELQKIINDSYVDFRKRFNIKELSFYNKMEKIYSKMIACKKKRYIGELKWKEGKVYDEAKYGQLLDIVGFETRRSDTSMFTKAFLKEFYKLLIDETPKWDVYKFVRKKMDEYKMASMDEIAQPKSYTKKFGEYQGSSANSVFIKSAEWSNLNLSYDFGEGTKCLFFYTKSTPVGGVCYMRGDSDKLVKMGIKVNWEKMIERGILMKLETIFEALGYDSVDLLSGSEQRKLFEFTEEDEPEAEPTSI